MNKRTAFLEHLRLLTQGDAEERADACFELGKAGDPRAITPLLESLDSNRVSSGLATSAIGRIGHPQSVTVLRDLARRENCRSHAIKALVDLATPAAHPEEARHLRGDEDRLAVCQAALACLVRLVARVPQTILSLLEVIDSPSTTLQLEGAVAILLRAGQPAIAALLPLLQGDDKSIRKLAAQALSAVGWIPTNTIEGAVFWIARGNWDACHAMGSIAVEPLISALQDADIAAADRKAIVKTLGRLGDDRALPAVLAAMTEEAVRESAIEALGRLGGRSAAQALNALLKTGARRSDRRPALIALVRLGAADAVDELTGFLADSPPHIRGEVERACVEGGGAIIGALRSMLSASHPAAVSSAARVLGALRDAGSVVPLISLLKHENPSGVENAAYALGHIRDARALEPLIGLVAVAGEAVETDDLLASFPPAHGLLQPHSPQSIAAWALGELGDNAAVEPIVAAWRNAPSFARPSLIVALAKLDPPRAAELLGFGSGGEPAWDDDREGRVTRELWRLGAAAVEPLAMALRESLRRDSYVTGRSFESMVFSLGRTREESAVAPLSHALRECERQQRRSVFSAFVEIGAPAVPELDKLLDHHDRDIMEHAARTLATIGGAEAVASLCDFCPGQDSPTPVLSAIQALRTLRDPRATPFLLDTLKSKRWNSSGEDRKILHRALLRAGLNPSAGLRYDKPERERDAAIDSVRLEAACSLAQLGVSDGDAPLIAALEHEEPEVRRQAVAALAHRPGAIDVKRLAARMFDWNPSVRLAAAESLGTRQDAASVRTLRIGLTDRHHDVRQAAAVALAGLGWRPRTRREQAEFWIARQDWRQCSAVGAPAVDPLTATLEDAAPFIRHAAIDALAACRGPEAAQALRVLVRQDGRQDMHAAALDAIARWRRTELGADIAECLRNEHESTVAAGIRALQALQIQPPTDLLVGLLQTADTEAAAVAASLLARSGDARAIPPLIAALDTSPVVVRQAAIRSLGQLGAQEGTGAGTTAFEVLVAQLHDPNQELRVAVTNALAACAGETTIGVFLWNLHIEQHDDETCTSIGTALANFAGIPFGTLQENRETTLREMVKGAAQRRLREHSGDAARACYTNALAFYTEKIGALAGDEEQRAFEQAAEFALALGMDGTELFVEAGNVRAAGDIARSAIELARVAGNYKRVWSALSTICKALTRAGDDRTTLEIHEKAVRLIESMWFFLPTEEVRLRAFFSDKAAIYDGLALCYQRLGATAQAWETLETAKARYLSDLIVRRQASPVESYSQVEDVVWSSVRRASAAAEGISGRAPSPGLQELVGIEPAGAEQDAPVLEPEHRRAYADFLESPASTWQLALIDDLWDAIAGWAGNPLSPGLRDAFRPLRACVHDALNRRGDGTAMTPGQFLDGIARSRDALDAVSLQRTIAAPFGSLADYLPGLRELANAFPPYSQARTLELQAVLEVLNVICGEGTVSVSTRARTPNDPPAKWRGVFQSPANAQPRRRRVHEASQRLEAAWDGFSETNWRYVTRVARGEPTSFARLRAMLEYESAHAIVALQVTAHGTVAHLFRGVLRDEDRRALPGRSDLLWSDVLTFHAWTLDRIQELITSGWLKPLRALERETSDEHEDAAKRLMSETLGRLYTEVVGPIVRRLRRWGIRRITFIPTRGLNVLPLHACWHESGGRKRYLADRYEVAYAPSATLLEICRTRSDRRVPWPAQFYGWSGSSGDLPFAHAEVASVARLFPTPAGAARPAAGDGNPGTETATHIHFACHGNYNWRDPLESGLQLGEDRRLRLADLFEDAFPISNASLVVLSACQTGMADPGDLADEYLGLTAGFLFAGAPAVVSTLWPVDDVATMFLMERFYRFHLHKRMSAGGALRQAQLWLRTVTAESVCRRLTAELKRVTTSEKDSPQEEIVRSAQRTMCGLEPETRPFADPYYWAAFTMNGVCQTG